MITIYIIEFILFSFIGWIIDSGYRSLTEKKWINAGYFRGPICPIYGFGAIVLIFIFKQFSDHNLLIPLIFGSVAMIAVEFFGGIFTEKVLKVKLWDYSLSKFHLLGHIDFLHSSYWVLLVIAFYFSILNPILSLEKIISIPEAIDLPFFIFFILISVWLTVRKIPAQFLVLKENYMNITVEKYQKLFYQITQYYQTKSLEKRKELLHLIKEQLKNTGARLRNYVHHNHILLRKK